MSKMGKFISVFVFIIMAIVIWQGFHFYSIINTPLKNVQDEALVFIKENTNIEIIEDIDFYHGTDPYHILHGVTDVGEKVIIWVPYTLDSYVIKLQEDGLSFNDVNEFANSELYPNQLISIKLGMENSIPLYEIIYKDQQGRYSYYFISFEDGTYLKHYHLKV